MKHTFIAAILLIGACAGIAYISMKLADSRPVVVTQMWVYEQCRTNLCVTATLQRLPVQAATAAKLVLIGGTIFIYYPK